MTLTSPFPKPEPRGNTARSIMTKIKLALQKFNDDQRGMNTVEAIILLFVAAIVLLVFFALIWPLIRESVLEQLNALFDTTGRD
jgi:hypothetical protein